MCDITELRELHAQVTPKRQLAACSPPSGSVIERHKVRTDHTVCARVTLLVISQLVFFDFKDTNISDSRYPSAQSLIIRYTRNHRDGNCRLHPHLPINHPSPLHTHLTIFSALVSQYFSSCMRERAKLIDARSAF